MYINTYLLFTLVILSGIGLSSLFQLFMGELYPIEIERKEK